MIKMIMAIYPEETVYIIQENNYPPKIINADNLNEAIVNKECAVRSVKVDYDSAPDLIFDSLWMIIDGCSLLTPAEKTELFNRVWDWI